MRTILITGGAGFIGSRLTLRLLEEGHRVVVLDNFDPYYDPAIKELNVRDAVETGGDRYTLVRGDIRSMDDLGRAWREGPFDRVVHLAARAGVRISIQEPTVYSDVNVTGTTNVLEMCREHGPDRLVFASSSSVYGDATEFPLREDMRIDSPVSPYAATKQAGELLCRTWNHLHGLHIIALRFFTVYGPGQRPEMAIHKFARLMARGEAIPFFGDGSSSRDYTFIKDIIDGVVRSLDGPEGYQVYNLGGGRPTLLTELVDGLARSMGIEPKLERLPFQSGDVQHTLASVVRAERDLGYRPTTPVSEGIPEFVRWFRRLNP